MKSRPHPEMGYRFVMGIMRLGKGVGDVRLEAACRREAQVVHVRSAREW